MRLKLIILKDSYAIYRFNNNVDIPEWIKDSDFSSVTRTRDELSIVSRQADNIKEEYKADIDWRIIKIQGPLNFSLVGIIAEISGILGDNNIPVFTVSTYDTDYILVKNRDIDKTIDSLAAHGHEITYEKTV
ncbi:MAG TPA: ACT domain-containing protein [Ignavibacteriaceae bacterium]|nr:ACT domain-containing protein [Ignavibacteriaceae bacterium]